MRANSSETSQYNTAIKIVICECSTGEQSTIEHSRLFPTYFSDVKSPKLYALISSMKFATGILPAITTNSEHGEGWGGGEYNRLCTFQVVDHLLFVRRIQGNSPQHEKMLRYTTFWHFYNICCMPAPRRPPCDLMSLFPTTPRLPPGTLVHFPCLSSLPVHL